jgi:hypothetical protein
MNTSTQSGSAPYISKSRFLQGLQCPKLLWNAYNAKHLFPEIATALQAVFDQGHEVGAFAKRMFPGGIEIETGHTDFEGAIQLTQKALRLSRPIFEATLSAHGGYARADILNPVGKDDWNIIEVKSTTGLKDVHIPDLALARTCQDARPPGSKHAAHSCHHSLCSLWSLFQFTAVLNTSNTAIRLIPKTCESQKTTL